MFDLSPDDITEGPVARALLVLAAPLLVQTLVQVVQQVVDLFWVGRISADAVAAVGLVFPLVALVYAVVVVGPFVGTQVLVAQRVGAENHAGARRALATGLVATIAVAVVVGALTYLGARPLVDLLLSTRPTAVAGAVPGLAATYLGVLALGLPVYLLADPLEGAFVGWGDSRASLYTNLTAVALNVVLDPLFIFGVPGVFDGFGIAGAALATVLSFTAGGAFGFALIAMGRNGGMLSRAAFALDADEFRALYGVGLPYAGQNLAKQSVDAVLVVVVFAAGGAAALAAYAVGVRVAALAVVPAIGLQQAAQSVVGQNIGAGKVERARRTTWVGVGIAAAGLTVLAVGQLLVPDLLVTVFSPRFTGETFALAREFLVVLAIGYPAIGIAYLFQAGFNGASRTDTSFYASLLQYWGVRLPVALVGGVLLTSGPSAVFWAVTGSNVLAAVGLGLYYRRETETGMLDRAAEAVAAD